VEKVKKVEMGMWVRISQSRFVRKLVTLSSVEQAVSGTAIMLLAGLSQSPEAKSKK
jgi:hypothetical protein